MAGHDLGLRIELGRRGYPRARGIPANAPSRQSANPTSTASGGGRLRRLYVLGREKHRAGVSLRPNYHISFIIDARQHWLFFNASNMLHRFLPDHNPPTSPVEWLNRRIIDYKSLSRSSLARRKRECCLGSHLRRFVSNGKGIKVDVAEGRVMPPLAVLLGLRGGRSHWAQRPR